MARDSKYDLSGKVALVTGATAFIGRAVALRLSTLGATVVINGRSMETGRQAVAEIEFAGGQVFFEKADITDGAQVEEMVKRVIERLGRIDILVASGAGASTDSLPFLLF